MSNSYRAV